MSLLPKECTICGKNYCEHQKTHQMTNLTEQDLKRIVDIENYLAQLHTLVPNAPIFDLTEPIVEPKEDNQQLVEIAKNKYPVGTTFINLYSDVRQVVANHKYTKYKDGELMVNGGLVWHNGTWATIVNKVEQKRWKPRKNQMYWSVDLSQENGIYSYVNINDEIDKLFYTTHNCFKTEQEAQEKFNQIRNILNKN